AVSNARSAGATVLIRRDAGPVMVRPLNRRGLTNAGGYVHNRRSVAQGVFSGIRASRKNGGAFALGELAPSAGRAEQAEVFQGDAADAHAQEAEGGVADGGGHAADLAVFTFVEGQGKPGIGHVFAKAHGRHAVRKAVDLGLRYAAHADGRTGVVGQAHAGRETGEGGDVGDAFHLHPVFAFMGMAGVEQAGVETGFVGEEEQALAVGVEATQGVDAGRQFRADIGEGAPLRTGFGGELGEHAVGFVESEEHGW
ncbi:MAG: hypothetical protein RL376_875, partial [Verrucomicrobiota bacterium]